MELVIVMSVLAILLAVAVPRYQAQIRASKEAVLKSNLAILRDRLDQYKADRSKYPQALQDLVEAGYLREIPTDPITETTEWEEVFEDFDPDQPDAEPGVFDVRCTDPEYHEW